MKVASIILAFYISLISCLPCQDEAEFHHNEAGINTQISRDNHSGESLIDLCSPFCICACCASVTIPPVVFGLLAIAKPVFRERQIFRYTKSFSQSDLALIWQPPRLA